MKLVLDTDVIIAGLRSPSGASAELLRLIRQGVFRPLLSVPMVLEYEAVATRPEHRLATGLTEAEIASVIDVMVDKAIWVHIDYLYRPVANDPADEFVAEAALNGGADAIVTFNSRDFETLGRRFRIDIIAPGEAVRRLRDGK